MLHIRDVLQTRIPELGMAQQSFSLVFSVVVYVVVWISLLHDVSLPHTIPSYL